MKKFLLIVLAVAFAAAPAMAGDFAASGKYWVQGISLSGYGGNEDNSDAWYINDFELITKLTSGDVTAVIDWELADSNWDDLYGHDVTRSFDVVDNYFVTAKLMDGLTLKTGEYNLTWGNNIAIWNQGGYNVGLTYSFDMLDLSGTIGKDTEGDKIEGGDVVDADRDEIVLSAIFKKAGPFTKLNLHIAYVNDELADASDNLIGVEFAVPAGPVKLAGELGFASGDNAEGNYVFVTAGLKDLVGFDFNVLAFMASDDLNTGMGEFWSPVLYLGNDDVEELDFGNWADTTFVALNGGYGINDKLTLGGTILYAMETNDDNGWTATEFDVTGTYKFADNFSIMAGAALFSESADGGYDYSSTLLTTKATFSF